VHLLVVAKFGLGPAGEDTADMLTLEVLPCVHFHVLLECVSVEEEQNNVLHWRAHIIFTMVLCNFTSFTDVDIHFISDKDHCSMEEHAREQGDEENIWI
jgi:hypothetical protein